MVAWLRIGYDVTMNKEKQWQYCQFEEEEVALLADRLNVTKIVAKVLIQAGFHTTDQDELDRFLSPKMDEILAYDGLSSKDELDKSLCRMESAKQKNEQILINGDPDADGISGTTILATGLRQLGFNVEYDFPIRSREGHGLQIRIIDEAKAKGVSLIITTDCGTKDVEAVDYANENGIDVIITDHHILGATLPNAVAIINPYLNEDAQYQEYRLLSGSFVAFKWIIALKEYLNQTFPKSIFETLVIASSFGVVSDRVNLKNPMNRAMVKLGIDYLNATQLPGMKALKEISMPTRSFLRARDISRTIAPRMNAPGRIGDPTLGIPDSSIIVDLLMSGLSIGPKSNIKQFIEKYKKLLHHDRLIKNDLEVSDQVGMVDTVNNKRKKITEEIESQIESHLSEVDISQQKILIIQGKNWNSGVIGIDADRLRDRFILPAIIVTVLDGSDCLKGSVRSIPNINMYQIMEKVQTTFQKKHGRNPYQIAVNTGIGLREVNAFGGHAQACGFSMRPEDLPEWEMLIREEMNQLPSSAYSFSYPVLANLRFFDVNPKLLHDLDTISPYGEGFDFPIFTLKNVILSTQPRPFGNRMQKDRTPHVEFKIFHSKKQKDDKNRPQFLLATAFGLYEKYQQIIENVQTPRADILFTLDYPHKKTKKKRPFPHLMVLDIKPSK